MAQIVVGLMEKATGAEKTVEELPRSGFERKHIGIISPEIDREAAAALAGGRIGMVYGRLGGSAAGRHRAGYSAASSVCCSVLCFWAALK